MSAYLLVSLQANYFQLETFLFSNDKTSDLSLSKITTHSLWKKGTTGKSSLNNLRLILQPYIFYYLIKPWLDLFNIPQFKRCFILLIEEMNHFFGLSTLCFSSLTPFHFLTG